MRTFRTIAVGAPLDGASIETHEIQPLASDFCSIPRKTLEEFAQFLSVELEPLDSFFDRVRKAIADIERSISRTETEVRRLQSAQSPGTVQGINRSSAPFWRNN